MSRFERDAFFFLFPFLSLFFLSFFYPLSLFIMCHVCARRKKDFEKKKTNFEKRHHHRPLVTVVWLFFFDIGRLLFSQNLSLKCRSNFCGCVFFFTTLVLLLIIEKDNNTTTLASYKTRYIILLSKDQEEDQEEEEEDGEPGSGGDAERATGEERERGAFAGGVGVDFDF